MINDLSSSWADRWKYVDDTTFTESVPRNSDSGLQNLVKEINDWTIQNKMKLNASKCKELIVDFTKDRQLFLPLEIDGVLVERVKSARVLIIVGLIIQGDMKWNEHVNSIVKKAGKRLYMLRIQKRSNANIETLLTVYTTVIRPVLEYACQVWHFNIPDYLCEEIEVVQKHALRIIEPL